LDAKNKELLEEEIGVLSINDELKSVYDRLILEQNSIYETKQKLKDATKPFIIFEGPSDNTHFELAHENLYNKPFEEDYKICVHLTSSNGSSQGSGARKVNDYLYNHFSKTPSDNVIIGVFDNDNEGYTQFQGLKKKSFKEIQIDGCAFKNIIQHKTSKNVFAITLWQPDFRDMFIVENKPNYCFVSTELLYKDDEIPNSNKLPPTLYDNTVFGFSGRKTAFAQKVTDDIQKGKIIDFSGFSYYFSILRQEFCQ